MKIFEFSVGDTNKNIRLCNHFLIDTVSTSSSIFCEAILISAKKSVLAKELANAKPIRKKLVSQSASDSENFMRG